MGHVNFWRGASTPWYIEVFIANAVIFLADHQLLGKVDKSSTLRVIGPSHGGLNLFLGPQNSHQLQGSGFL